jgi:taurine dioxygenase
MAQLQVKKVGYALGAEASGVDLTLPLDQETIVEIRQAWLEHPVLYFRSQGLDADQLAAFTRQFGELDKNETAPLRGRGVIHPNVLLNSNQPVNGKPWDGHKNGTYWHTDRSFTPIPAIGTFLLCKEAPEVGGDTLYANTYMAYETLSPAMKALIEPLYALHDSSRVKAAYGNRPEGNSPPPVEHPLVRIHSETHRKALYVGERVYQIVGMTEEESAPLLDYLNRHAVTYEFTYRHRWKANDLLMWDNRCTLHNALSDYDQRNQPRTMYRCSLQGDDWTHPPETVGKYVAVAG